MAPDHQVVDESPATAPDATSAAPELGSFTAEFRGLARQRRFRRSSPVAAMPEHGAPVAAVPVIEPHPTPRAVPRATPSSAPTIDISAMDRPAPPPAPRAVATAASPAGHRQPARDRERAPRLSTDPYGVLVELSRMADRVIESREQLAAERARADHAEREAEALRDRVLAARALVHEAQRTARLAADRCEFLEGRCDALQDALDIALNASLLTRWKWRRMARRST